MENNPVTPMPEQAGSEVPPMPPVDNASIEMPEQASIAGTQSMEQQPAQVVEPTVPVVPEAPAVNMNSATQETPQQVPVAPTTPAAPVQDVSSAAAPKKTSFFEKLKNIDWKNADIKTLFQKNPEDDLITGTSTMFEVNLVPAVKAEMIKSIKLKNMILFICLIIGGISLGIVGILGGVVAGQKISSSNKTTQIEAMSSKIQSFDGLDEYLMVKNQLGGIASINEKRQVLSRVFSFLSVILPSGPDSITISELSMDLSTDTLTFSGQADAGIDPYIDYRVLESFKKSLALVKYDYGWYVDEEDNEIPTRCMVEANDSGATLTNDSGDIYAYWMKSKDKCDVNIAERAEELEELEEELERIQKQSTSTDSSDSDEDDDNGSISSTISGLLDDEEEEELRSEDEVKADIDKVYEDYADKIDNTWYDDWLKENNLTRSTDDELSDDQKSSIEAAYQKFRDELSSDEERWIVDEMIEDGVDYRDILFEKVYRTPQYKDWYKNEYMTTDGTISGVSHFASQCVKYSGEELEGKMRWTSENEDCTLVDGDIEITDSSNGRDASDNLVLKFDASLLLNEEPMLFSNKHVMAIGPDNQNVTDSYVQIEEMFGEEADDCKSSDVVCIQNDENVNGEEEDD